MKGLDSFILRIENFHSLLNSKKIDFFVYFLLIENKFDGIIAKDIQECYDSLHIKAYSNIQDYLRTNSKGKKAKFLKKSNKYYLERTYKENLDLQFGKIPIPKARESKYLPLEIFDNTRGYLQKLAEQAINSYDLGLFDGCSVLSRKLIEILIIECFEKHKIEDLIRKDGNFFYLSDLIAQLQNEPKWNLTRNAKQSLPKIKKIGDLSAHNRRYIARKADIDNIKEDLRIIIEELIHLIDYQNWK
jgi:hypothetical protein